MRKFESFSVSRHQQHNCIETERFLTMCTRSTLINLCKIQKEHKNKRELMQVWMHRYDDIVFTVAKRNFHFPSSTNTDKLHFTFMRPIYFQYLIIESWKKFLFFVVVGECYLLCYLNLVLSKKNLTRSGSGPECDVKWTKYLLLFSRGREKSM